MLRFKRYYIKSFFYKKSYIGDDIIRNNIYKKNIKIS